VPPRRLVASKALGGRLPDNSSSKNYSAAASSCNKVVRRPSRNCRQRVVQPLGGSLVRGRPQSQRRR
jgi:hypothetical protein